MVEEGKIVKRLTLVSILGNFILFGIKLIAGFTGHSNAMTSDAIHSLSDVLTTFVAFLGVQFSKKEADKEHPYGHERTECVASLILGTLLFVIGLEIGLVGINTLLQFNYDSIQPPKFIALAAAIISILSKEAMYWYTRHYAKILNSTVFMADAWHHRSDAFSSIGSLIGIAGGMLGYPIMDSIASIVISIFILKVSCDILKEAISKMVDTSCGTEYDNKLKEYISKQDGVIAIDLLQSRTFGNRVYVELELQVDGELNLKDAHKIAEEVHDKVEKNFKDIKHITIHLNPASV